MHKMIKTGSDPRILLGYIILNEGLAMREALISH